MTDTYYCTKPRSYICDGPRCPSCRWSAVREPQPNISSAGLPGSIADGSSVERRFSSLRTDKHGHLEVWFGNEYEFVSFKKGDSPQLVAHTLHRLAKKIERGDHI